MQATRVELALPLRACLNQSVKALDELCRIAGTFPDDWEFIDGTDGAVGVDYWLPHKPTGEQACVNDDQGVIKVDCNIDCLVGRSLGQLSSPE